MGVHGLWKLLEPSGKPVPVETLENQVLSVDVSIWLHQLLQGYRDTGGSSVPNAHLMGLFQRVCKLLFFRVKPVFVFDGGVPNLKRKTIGARQQQRDKSVIASEKVRQQLLKNLLKQRAVNQVLGDINAIPSTSTTSKEHADMYELPAIERGGSSESECGVQAYSSESEEDVRRRGKYKDLHNIDVHSAEFKALPADIRHDILTELKEKRKESSWGHIHEMPEDSGQFSSYQMNRLLKRRSVQVSLEEAEKEMGGRTFSLNDVEALLTEQGIDTTSTVGNRIASDNVTRYLYITDSAKETGEINKSDKESNVDVPKDVDIISETSKKLSSGDKEEKSVTEVDKNSETKLLSPVKEEIFDLPDYSEIKIESDNSSDEIIFDELNKDFEISRKFVIENKGITQEQILSIIKDQNKKYTNSVNLNDNFNNYNSNDVPSTSSQVEVMSSMDSFKESSLINKKENSQLNSIFENDSVLEISERKSQDINNTLDNISKNQFNEINSKILINNEKSDTKDQLTEVADKDKTVDEKSVIEEIKVNSLNHSSTSDSNSDNFIEINSMESEPNLTTKNKSQNSPVLQVTINTKQKDVNDEEDIFADVFKEVANEKEQSPKGINKSFNELSNANIDYMSSSDSNNSDDAEICNSPVNHSNPNLLKDKINNKSVEPIMSQYFEPTKSIDKNDKESFESSFEINNKVVNEEVGLEDVVSLNKQTESFETENESTKPSPLKNVCESSELTNSESINVDDKNSTSDSATEVSKPKKKISTKELHKLQIILEEQEGNLVQKQNKESRLASTVTEQMRLEAQELLQLFGVPWVMAPMEAEAQCAFLDRIGLTQGTITDDSDVWLFGAKRVYKNFFNQKKFVLQFQAQDIQHFFKLSRGDLIELALLVGSDYTVGVTGVGPVTALEIIAMFRPASSTDSSILTTLSAFKDWLQHPSNTDSPLARKLKDVNLDEGFPSKDVVEAYLHPLVDESEETFTWGTPDLDGLREFAKRKFGWSRARIDEILLPVMKSLSQKTSQSRIDSFFSIKPSMPAYTGKVSNRVQKAIYRLGGERHNPLDEPEMFGGSSNQRRRGGSELQNKRRQGKGRASLSIEPPPPPKPLPLPIPDEIIPQRERDKQEAIKRKMEAIEIMKKKRNKIAKKRSPRAPIKREANLSESSSDEN